MNCEIQVGEAVRYERLSVFPLFTKPNGGVDYQLSDEAIGAGSVTVEEVDQAGSVPDLTVENQGDTRVLFLEGEELVGAKQNRVLNCSVLIAAKSKIKIPVSCVEQGRWGYKSRRFGSSGLHTFSSLRYVLKASVTRSSRAKRGHRSDQGEVWEEVARRQELLGTASPTGAMSDTYDSFKDRIAEFQQKLSYSPGASGMAVAVGEKVVAVDLFDKPSTCRKVWNRLLTGFVLDALAAQEDIKPVEVAEVRKLLAVLDDTSWESVDAVGEGDECRLETDVGDHASTLCLDGSLVHASVVAGA